MCSYIVEKAKLLGSAKGPNGWMRIDTANVYYDHPFHAPLDHALGIDQHRIAQRCCEPLRQWRGARRHEAREDADAVMGERDDVAADRLAAHAGRIAGADQRPERGAGNRRRPQTQFVERLDHRHMGKRARPAHAERQRKGLRWWKCVRHRGRIHVAPAWRA